MVHYMQHTTLPNRRIEYLDALRGFTMILVVVTHVAKYLDIETLEPGNFHYYLKQFRMPLFFFISGFVFYKERFVWNIENTKRFLSKKVTVQIISPFIFFACYLHYMDFPFWEYVVNDFKAGYWFTFTLFEYFLLYIAIRKISDIIGIKEERALAIMLFTGLFLFLFPKQWLYSESRPQFVLDTVGFFSVSCLMYFIFFVLGAWTKKNFAKVEKLLDGSYLVLTAVAIYFTANIFMDLPSQNLYIQKIMNLLLSVCGVVMIFGLFRKHQSFFAANNPTSSLLRFIGRRTLNIYLLHFFFINFDLPEQILSFIHNSSPLLEYAISLLLATLAITACLAVSSLLRTSNLLAHYLFGAPKKQEQ